MFKEPAEGSPPSEPVTVMQQSVQLPLGARTGSDPDGSTSPARPEEVMSPVYESSPGPETEACAGGSCDAGRCLSVLCVPVCVSGLCVC